jgi:hypothetical protein
MKKNMLKQSQDKQKNMDNDMKKNITKNILSCDTERKRKKIEYTNKRKIKERK